MQDIREYIRVKKAVMVALMLVTMWGSFSSTAFAQVSLTALQLPIATDLVNEGRIPVYVAAYEFPPYYSSRLSEHFLGTLVAELNQLQTAYLFIIHEVRPQARYAALGVELPNGSTHSNVYQCCDVMFFESEAWGWPQHSSVIASRPMIYGADRLYSNKNEFFPLTSSDIVGGVVGYHYHYAGYATSANAGPNGAPLYRADSQLTLLNMLRNNRLQYALFTDEFIHWLAVEYPELISGIYPAPRVDGEYATQVLVAGHSSISYDELIGLINHLMEQPNVIDAMERYQLQPVKHSQ